MTMAIIKVSVFCIFLLTVASASIVAIRSTDWNEIGIYTVNKTSGIVEQTDTGNIELYDNPMLAQSPYDSSFIYFELNQQVLSAYVFDSISGGQALVGGFLNVGVAPTACGGATYASKDVVYFSCIYGGGFELYSLDITKWNNGLSPIAYMNGFSQPLFAAVNPTNSNEVVLVSRDQKNTFLESDHVTVFNLGSKTHTMCKAPFLNSTISQPVWNDELNFVFLIQHPTSNSLAIMQVSVVSLTASNCQWNVITSFNQVRMVPSTVQLDVDEPSTLLWLSPDNSLFSYDLESGSVSGALLVEKGSNKVYSFAALLHLRGQFAL